MRLKRTFGVKCTAAVAAFMMIWGSAPYVPAAEEYLPAETAEEAETPAESPAETEEADEPEKASQEAFAEETIEEAEGYIAAGNTMPVACVVGAAAADSAAEGVEISYEITVQSETFTDGVYDGVAFVNHRARVGAVVGLDFIVISGFPADALFTVTAELPEGYAVDSVSDYVYQAEGELIRETYFEIAADSGGSGEYSLPAACIVGSFTNDRAVEGQTVTYEITAYSQNFTDGFYSGIEFVNRKASVQLAVGEDICIAGFPADTQFTVNVFLPDGCIVSDQYEYTGQSDDWHSRNFVYVIAREGSLPVACLIGATAFNNDPSYEGTLVSYDITVNSVDFKDGVYGEITFADGKAHVDAVLDENIYITGFPADATFDVEIGLPENYRVYDAVTYAEQRFGYNMWNYSFQIIRGNMLPFTDVPPDYPYYNEIADIYTRGLMTGVTETTFEPETTLNRAFFAAVLYRRAGSPAAVYDGSFPDVKQNDWFAQCVMWASTSGNIVGYNNGKFGPTDTLTREQVCTVLWRTAASMDGCINTERASLSDFEDGANVSDYAKDAVQWCVAKGIISGKNGRLDPWSPATRAELAVMMSRYLKAVGK